MKAPAIKFIGDKEMIIPIMSKEYMLSHKAYANYYYPIIIEVIDSSGLLYRYQKAEVLVGIRWWKSIKHISLMHRIKPILTDDPVVIELSRMKDKVLKFITKVSKYKGLANDEKEEIITRVNACDSHHKIIEVINAVSYWK